MTRAKTDAERKAAERDRKRQAGRVRVMVDVWVRPADLPAVERYAEKIRRIADKASGAL